MKASRLANVWIGVLCTSVIVGCGRSRDGTDHPASAAQPPNAVPSVAAVRSDINPSSQEGAAAVSAESLSRSEQESAWHIVGETDEMTNTRNEFALYKAKVGDSTLEVKMTCPATGASGAVVQVTTYDGLLATSYDEVLQTIIARGRIDTGNGEVGYIVLEPSDKYRNVYTLSTGGALGKAWSVGQQLLSLEGDQSRLKLELEFSNGVKHIVRGDSKLGLYLSPCRAKSKSQQESSSEKEDTSPQTAGSAVVPGDALSGNADEKNGGNEQAAVEKVIVPPSSQGRGVVLIQPEYPAASRRAQESGVVTMRVYVLEDGRVGDVTVVRSSGFERLDESAIQAVRKWRLQAGTEDGRPKAMWHELSLTFRTTQ